MSATRPVRRSTLQLMAQEWAQHVGRAIRARRKELGIGPTAFSQEMHASLKTIERWERGDTDGALRQLDEIAKVLKTTPAELVAMAPATDEEIEERETPDLSLNDADRLDRIERKLDDLQEKVDEGLAALRTLSATVTPEAIAGIIQWQTQWADLQQRAVAAIEAAERRAQGRGTKRS